MVSCRSTKGASKARRDQINAEIRNLRTLLPISAQDQQGLSYLHSMAIICIFIRKTVFFRADGDSDGVLPLYNDLLEVLPGFIIAATTDGKLLYVSDNVSQYLGFSMVEILQSDSFFSLISSDDVDSVKLHLDNQTAAGSSFMCNMKCSKSVRRRFGGFCPLLLRGRVLDSERHMFVVLCSPTVDRLTDGERLSSREHFQSKHGPDMSFTDLQQSVALHLGYEAEELIGQSWYSMLHPQDLSITASAHTHLMQQGGGDNEEDGEEVEMVFRLQTKSQLWIWIYSRALKLPQNQITCTNYLISETEAMYLRQKLYSSVCSPLPWGPGPCTSQKRPAGDATSAEPRKKIRRISESKTFSIAMERTCENEGDASYDQSFSTPLYSPASSTSSSSPASSSSSPFYSPSSSSSPSPTSSPSFPSSLSLQAFPQSSFDGELHSNSPASFSYPECPAEDALVPEYCSEACESSDCVFHFDDDMLPELVAGVGVALPATEDSGYSSVADQLTSDQLVSVPGSVTPPLCYTEQEQAEISVLAEQISSLARSFDAYRTNIQESDTQSAPCRLNEELLLDNDIIDSILRNWDGETVRTHSDSSWEQSPRIPDTDRLHALSMDVPVNPVPLEPWPSVYRPDCHEENNELYQLNFNLNSNFQQEFAAESMYGVDFPQCSIVWHIVM
ncbi:neuronal PAS domain-containing protein 4-like [Hoplias malabaricus]|uniref:neuronal PAS domain-containing protein 4-like n=1 Tax=Hoplias malabaricus TaxID=27720 RepID=UPI003462D2ED